MNHIKREGDIITIRSGGPDEWKATHAIRDALITNPQDLCAAQSRATDETNVAAAKDTVTVTIGGKDENQVFVAITAHLKALAQDVAPQTASQLPSSASSVSLDDALEITLREDKELLERLAQ